MLYAKPTAVNRKFRSKPNASKHGLATYQERKRAGVPIAWNIDYAKRIPWYPKSPQAWEAWCERTRVNFQKYRDKVRAEGKQPATRMGIPGGWRGGKAVLAQIRGEAAAEAKDIVKYMIKNSIIGTPEDPRAEEALEEMIAIVRAKSDAGVHAYSAGDRIKAANTVLSFTKQKPAFQQNVTLQRAEDFLDAIALEVIPTKE